MSKLEPMPEAYCVFHVSAVKAPRGGSGVAFSLASRGACFGAYNLRTVYDQGLQVFGLPSGLFLYA